MTNRRIQRALISVSDKTGLIELATALQDQGIELISTGGTHRALTAAGIAATEISEVTGFPEIMGGRVKTLHPAVFAALLHRGEQDEALLQEHQITPIDLVVVNLYPFAQTIRQADCPLALAIENIDIGGPSMIRAAAKNYRYTTVITSPQEYAPLIAQLSANDNQLTESQRLTHATLAFRHTARYEATIANYLQQQTQDTDLVEERFSHLQKKQDLRYGENPHQRAAFYVDEEAPADSLANAEQLQGKALSFNNIADTHCAFECVKQFETPTCVIVKHANPCGVASAASLASAYTKAFACDPVSAFGGIIAFNETVEEDVAKQLLANQFCEVIIAPDYSNAARDVFASKKGLRLLAYNKTKATTQPFEGWDLKRVSGGVLIQEFDRKQLQESALEVVTDIKPSPEQIRDMLFAWQVVRFIKSNAVVFAKNNATVGVGAGQMSRVFSIEIAAKKAHNAGLSLEGSIIASDAFLPFADNIDAVAKHNVAAIIQPGGSIRDQEVIDAANQAGIAMVFTSIRHFWH